MASTYTGDPTATQAPGDVPGPDNSPKVSLPADADTRNAASVAQALKEPVDWIAWLKDPRARNAQWSERTWGVKNARGQRRWFFDHLGHPSGRVVHWQEDWSGTDAQSGNGSSAFTKTRQRVWTTSITEGGATGSQIAAQGPSDAGVPSSKLSRVLNMKLGTAVADQTNVSKNAIAAFMTTNGIAIEWDVYIGTTGFAETLVLGGMADSGPTVGMNGALLYTDSSGNWKAVSGDGAALTTVDTGVSPTGGVWQKLRLEWWGSGVADDTTSALRFYVNNFATVAATITTHLPTGSDATPFFRTEKKSGAAQNSSFLGPLQVSYNF